MVAILQNLALIAWLEHKKVLAGVKAATIIGGINMGRRRSGRWSISGRSNSGTAPARANRMKKRRSKRRGIKAAVQRVIPGGETGYTSEIARTPGISGAVQRAIPGGKTGYELNDLSVGTHGTVVKSWTGNGAHFNLNQDGTITVLKKNGQIKTYRPYKPTVFGKEPDAKKFIKMAKKHKKIWKELNSVFKKPDRRK